MAKIKTKHKVVQLEITVQAGEKFTKVGTTKTVHLVYLKSNEAALVNIRSGVISDTGKISGAHWDEVFIGPDVDLQYEMPLDKVWENLGYDTLEYFMTDYLFDGKQEIANALD